LNTEATAAPHPYFHRAAKSRDAFAHAVYAVATGFLCRLGDDASTVVLDKDGDGFGGSRDADARRGTGSCVLHCIGERFLDDAIRREFHACRHVGRAHDFELDRKACIGHLLGQSRQGRERWDRFVVDGRSRLARLLAGEFRRFLFSLLL
jgi:hypothetical protein